MAHLEPTARQDGPPEHTKMFEAGNIGYEADMDITPAEIYELDLIHLLCFGYHPEFAWLVAPCAN